MDKHEFVIGIAIWAAGIIGALALTALFVTWVKMSIHVDNDKTPDTVSAVLAPTEMRAVQKYRFVIV